LTGELSYQPAYFGTAPDPETMPHVSTLAAINRAGLVTDQSQPGELWPAGGQRAFITGFCDVDTIDRLRHFLLLTDLVLLACWPGAQETTFQLPVTVDGSREQTWVGAIFAIDELIYQYGQALSQQAVLQLVGSWQVAVVDPSWGRIDVLFSEVLRALTTAGPIPEAASDAVDDGPIT
jgi:hypothetical protein